MPNMSRTITRIAMPKEIIKPKPTKLIKINMNVRNVLTMSVNKVTNKANCVCDVCGITYINSIMFIYSANKYVCRFCHIITNINYGYNDEVELYWSQLNQSDIINNTYEYYKQHKCMPKPIEIDRNLEMADISIVELIYLLKNPTTKENIINNNYKLFFTNNFNCDFINLKEQDNSSCFDSDSDDDDNSNSVNNSNPNYLDNYYIKNNEEVKHNETKKVLPQIKTKNITEFKNFFSI